MELQVLDRIAEDNMGLTHSGFQYLEFRIVKIIKRDNFISLNTLIVPLLVMLDTFKDSATLSLAWC
jgi:hypothetical protein